MGCTSSAPASKPGESTAAQPAPGRKVEVYGVTGSMNCMSVIMLASDNNILDLKVTMPQTDTAKPEFLKINPMGSVPAIKDGDMNLGESVAILRYLAATYAPAAYPTDTKTRAHINWACDRFSSSMYADAYATIYPVLGYSSRPDDPTAAAKKCVENLTEFSKKFLTTKFVGGDEPSIADYKVAPFFFCYEHASLQAKSGVTCPDRIKSFNKDFASKSKSFNMLIQAEGYGLKELLEKSSEVTGDVPTGEGFVAPEGEAPVLPKDLKTEGKVELYGVPASFNAVGCAMLMQEAECGEMKPTMPGKDTMKEDFLKINPFHGIPAVKDGDYCVAESSVVLRYLAETYKKDAYPEDVKKRAFIDWSIDRFSSAMYSPDVYNCLYPILGFVGQPADQKAAGQACTERLVQFCEVFLKEKFVGGETVSIADYKIAPYFFLYEHEEVQKISGVTCPDRIKKFNADFAEAVKSTSMLREAGGNSIKEVAETKIKEGKNKGIFQLLKESVMGKKQQPNEPPVTTSGNADFTGAAPEDEEERQKLEAKLDAEQPAGEMSESKPSASKPEATIEDKQAPKGGCCG